jgi:hypothetical protein
MLRLAVVPALAGLLALVLGPGRAGLSELLSGGASAVAAPAVATPPTSGDAFTPELELPATDVVAFGTSPLQAPGEAWAYGELAGAPAVVEGREYSDQPVLLEHTDASGWQVVPLPPSPEGAPLAGTAESEGPAEYGALAGQATAAGGVVLLSGQNIVVRDPDGDPRLLSPPEAVGSGSSSGGVLAAGESLLPPQAPSGDVTVPYAALEEPSIGTAPGRTGVLIAPYNDGADNAGVPSTQPGVLHYDGTTWSREPIAVPSTEGSGFTVQALACGGTAAAPVSSSSANCWLLASAKESPANGAPAQLLLFRRMPSGEPPGYAWEPQPVSDWLLGVATPPSGVTQRTVAPLAQGAQMLTVTAQGAWVDFQAQINGERSPVDVTELVAPGSPAASVMGVWCSSSAGLICSAEHTLGGTSLPAHYRSFAWSPPPGSPPGDAGTRIVTGLPNHTMLELDEGGAFTQTIGAGGDAHTAAPGGAAFGSPTQGWVADGESPIEGADGEGQSQAVELSSQFAGDQLQEEAVPFRRPLLALAQAPGSTPGASGAEAIAVGVEGEVAHYTPAQGWRAEALYAPSGKVEPPTLRGVAWPEPTRAYAVGDGGAMWVWRSETGLWEPDPAKPYSFVGNLTAIAFSPADPQLGYAVGKQGVLLRYGKSWEQMPLPPELQQVNFTSVTFAGGEALAVYRTLAGGDEVGGVAVEDGAGWQVDPAITALLQQLPAPRERVLSKIAGLPEGGAVAAGPGLVIECNSECGASTAQWHFSSEPLPQAQNISALGAYREDAAGPVRAVVSIDLDQRLNPAMFDGNLEQGPYAGDVPAPTGPGQPPPFIGADPLPNSGYVLKETASGWVDMEHGALPADVGQPSDQPIRPDPVLALLVAPDGSAGLAVGGQTDNATGAENGSGSQEAEAQTAAAMRFPAAAASTNGATPSPVAVPAGQASFVVGGQAACVLPCADFANESLGPEVWLSHALTSANQIATGSQGGLRAFFYTGGGEEVLSRELSHYGEALPVYAPGTGGSDQAFLSTGASGGAVMVIVLADGPLDEAQLTQQLAQAEAQEVPAIVVGNPAPNPALTALLLRGEASAYFYDSPGANVKIEIGSGPAGEGIWAYGTGTLGYTEQGSEPDDSLAAASGFLLTSVRTATRKPGTNVVPVTAEMVPNIAQLALDATDGVLLRRSHVALFEALARRPPAGIEAAGESGSGREIALPDPYDQIPFDCQGHNCAFEIATGYTFSSSNPDIGDFVAHEAGSANPRQVELGANKLPIPDPHSGLFCAYNEGTTTVSITAGGLTYSEPITVQGGSVEYPCGTVPLKNPPVLAAPASAAFALPGLAPSSAPPAASPLVQTLLPPPPPSPPSPPPAVQHAPAPLAPIPFIPLVQPLAGAPPAIVPPISPPVARPIPPSGTSQVYQSVAAPQREREEEAAGELASNDFSAYDPREEGWLGPWMVPLAIIAAGAGVGIRRSVRPMRRRRRRPALARSGLERRRYRSRW